MNTKEYNFSDFKISGFLAIIFVVILFVLGAWVTFDASVLSPFGAIFIVLGAFCTKGFVIIEPNVARIMILFGKYKGTVTDNGFFWVNPFLLKKELTLRARNLDINPIKVNDKVGNPIMIGAVLVWRVKDTYKAMFDIDAGGGNAIQSSQNFVLIQSDAALRQVAGMYAYDNHDNNNESITLRSDSDEVSQRLEDELNSRLSIAGIEVIEARINYLAYAAEIASVMLRRQQADAIISAREKIVEGAVSMVQLALNKLEKDNVVTLNDEKKAAMVSNLLVVLCADESAQPIVNAGAMNQ